MFNTISLKLFSIFTLHITDIVLFAQVSPELFFKNHSNSKHFQLDIPNIPYHLIDITTANKLLFIVNSAHILIAHS